MAVNEYTAENLQAIIDLINNVEANLKTNVTALDITFGPSTSGRITAKDETYIFTPTHHQQPTGSYFENR